ncbi:MAG: hypothetical protein HFG27_07660 [Provencibacterium sp.]|jgi:hypothetical protein|nr:hypothetical protein [Provencibacterium sp.]
MKEKIARFCGECGYPAEAQQELLAVYAAIEKTSLVREVFVKAGERYAQSPQLDYLGILEELKAACGQENIPVETASLLLFICFVPQLYLYYAQQNLPERLCRESLMDLKWKLYECHKVRGIWGSFVSGWFSGFFDLTRFTLGRLQFELRPVPEGYMQAGRTPPPGVQQAINMHIPSSGPLLHEQCLHSYRLAQEFFADAFPGGETVFICNSWLLFPEHWEFLPAHSHILEFMDDFDIYASRTDPQGSDLWRIFGLPDCSDTANLPEETSLQRAYKGWLLSGKQPGTGNGLFILKN